MCIAAHGLPGRSNQEVGFAIAVHIARAGHGRTEVRTFQRQGSNEGQNE
jgi:hypothetical protein